MPGRIPEELDPHIGVIDDLGHHDESRFVIAPLLAAAGHPGEALTEFEAVRQLLAEAVGADSTPVRNLDQQVHQLRPG